jgi:tRNA(Ile)-lysidine synthase
VTTSTRPVALAGPFVDDMLRRCEFPPVESVTCAVSGGADSTAMMALALASGRHVTAIHVDHGIRPESAAEAHVVAVAAERLGARFEARSVEVTPGSNLEARARAARRSVLPPDSLFGHTADDQAETVLMHLLRGSGPDGLAAMSPDRHPVLRLRRADTVRVCEELGLEPIVDVTNFSSAFRRNRIRHEVLPLLDDITDSDVVPMLARAADHQRGAAVAIDGLVDDIDPTDAGALRLLEPFVAGAVLRRWWRSVTGAEHPPDRAAVERMLDVAGHSAVGADVADGWQIRRSNDRLRLEKTGARP